MPNGVARDIKHAARRLAKAPVFAVTVILTLALGIGFNTAIFSVADRLLFRSLPLRDAERIVMLHETRPTAPRMDVSPANWLDWQRDSTSFEGLAAWTNGFPATLTGEGEPERVAANVVSHEFFPVLGVQPLLGRSFTAEDDQPGGPSLAILSYSLWQRRFGGDAAIIGRTIELNETPTEIIGVMPEGFRFLSTDTEVWRPFALDRSFDWRAPGIGRFLPFVVGRLKPGVEAQAAQAEMAAIAARLGQLHAFNRDTSVKVIPLREVLTGQVRSSVLVLFAAVGVLLLIACLNVANLMLARAATRRRELAVLASLGAGRSVIARQVIVESLLLALAGGAAAVAVAKWSVAALLAMAPPGLLGVASVPLDRWVLLYAFGIALLTGVLVGLVPAISATRAQLVNALRDGTRAVTSSTRARQALVVAQVAMSVVLLCGAGLLARSLLLMTTDPTGLTARDVLTMDVVLPVSRYRPEQQVAFFREALENLASLPGVRSAGAARDIPMSMARISGTSFRIDGEPEPPPNERLTTLVRVVTPGYFATLGIPLVQGREFTYEDPAAGSAPVFVVNESFAKRFLRAKDPLAAALSVNMQGAENPYGAIVGVAGDVKDGSLRGTAEPTVFYSNSQLASPGMTLMIRTSRGPELAREAVNVIRRMDANLPVTHIRTLDSAFGDSVARDRLNLVVMTAFAISALLLASLGLYGLLGYTVTERTSEIGLRMALGARAEQVLGMLMLHGLKLIAVGAILGLVGAAALGRLLESLLFGITARDPLTFAGVVLLLGIVCVVAALLPARRAARVDPMVALRNE